jgi:hypothetical protein
MSNEDTNDCLVLRNPRGVEEVIAVRCEGKIVSQRVAPHGIREIPLNAEVINLEYLLRKGRLVEASIPKIDGLIDGGGDI